MCYLAGKSSSSHGVKHFTVTTSFPIHWELCTLHSEMYTSQNTLQTVHSTLRSVDCTLYSVRWEYFRQWALHSSLNSYKTLIVNANFPLGFNTTTSYNWIIQKTDYVMLLVWGYRSSHLCIVSLPNLKCNIFFAEYNQSFLPQFKRLSFGMENTFYKNKFNLDNWYFNKYLKAIGSTSNWWYLLQKVP